MDYTALKTEISDPSYAGKTDAQIAEAINAKTVSTARTTMSGNDLLDNTAPADISAFTAVQAAAYWGLVGLATIKLDSAGAAFNILKNLFGSTTTTRANLLNLLNTQIVTAYTQVTYGVPYITADDVAAAKARA